MSSQTMILRRTFSTGATRCLAGSSTRTTTLVATSPSSHHQSISLFNNVNRSYCWKNKKLYNRRQFFSTESKPPVVQPPPSSSSSGSTNTAGSLGAGRFAKLYERTRDRGPVSWTQLFLVTVVAGAAVTYFGIKRERRLEQVVGKIVSSESDGWSPDDANFGRRKFVKTKYGWFPIKDGYSGGTFFILLVLADEFLSVLTCVVFALPFFS
jgi:hypothetical protein